MIKRLSLYILIALLGIAATGCRHKGFEMEEDASRHLRVVFDWRKAPDADPASMVLFLFEKNGGAPIRFVFSGRDGGEISVPYGHYDAIAMNADNTDWALLRNTAARETFEIYTDRVSAFSLPARADDEEVEQLKNTPGMLWTASDGTFSVMPTDPADLTITLYPEEAVCHYTVDVYDVENITSLEETSLMATCSGLAEGDIPFSKAGTDVHETLPFVLTADKKTNSLHGEFLTFGESPNIYKKNIITIHTFSGPTMVTTRAEADTTEHKVNAYDFDVSNQAHLALDPHHVHIVIRGLPLPRTVVVGSGVRPDVEDWITENIPLSM
ncbi:MAG: DUF5119 domain-containing protein [Duncaniella sp.]|nr:DUF5119 domain-containing protein [Duncaniella sp.]